MQFAPRSVSPFVISPQALASHRRQVLRHATLAGWVPTLYPGYP